MKFKLLDITYSTEVLLGILPFETGYLLKKDELTQELRPCENSVMLAMMLRSVEFSMDPYKLETPPYN